jgi:MFS transporter, FSR family, fosmidomycin resistance protein
MSKNLMISTDETTKMNTTALVILSAGHMATDINQGALPALLPFFKGTFGLSYTAAGIILLAGNLTSSVIQPAFGYLSDRKPIGWLLPLAPFTACLGMSLTGLLPHYSLLLISVSIFGLGAASFHPEGYKTAYFFTGEKKATGMSIFSVGGNLGMALGPVWALTLVTAFGMKGTLGMIVPGILMTVVFLFSISWLTIPVQAAFKQVKTNEKSRLSRDQIRTLLVLVSFVIVRSWIQMGLVAFIPFYYIDYLKGDPLYAGKLISVYLMAGALGTLLGAPFADRWGHKKFLSITMLSTFPLLLVFYFSGSSVITFLSLGIAGMVVISTFSPSVIMAQVLLPQHLGMAAGIMVGFAVGTGGVGVTLLGTVADIWGVPMAMKTILAMPLIAYGISLLVKYPPKKE